MGDEREESEGAKRSMSVGGGCDAGTDMPGIDVGTDYGGMPKCIGMCGCGCGADGGAPAGGAPGCHT